VCNKGVFCLEGGGVVVPVLQEAAVQVGWWHWHCGKCVCYSVGDERGGGVEAEGCYANACRGGACSVVQIV